MSKTKRLLCNALITLVMWAISRFLPASANAIYPDGYVLWTVTSLALLPTGWFVAEVISKGKYTRCVRANLYVIAAIEIMGLSGLVLNLVQNLSFYTGQYATDMNGIAYSDYVTIYGGTILFEIVYIALCFYLAKKTGVAKIEEAIPQDPEAKEIGTEQNKTVETGTPEADTITKSDMGATSGLSKAKKRRYCKFCGGAIDPETKKCSGCGKQYFHIRLKKPTFFAVATIVIILVLAGANVYQFIQYQAERASLEKQISELAGTIQEQESMIDRYKSTNKIHLENIEALKKNVRNLSAEKNELTKELFFYEWNVAIVPDDGKKLYHKYDCNRLDGYRFWIYGTETAKSKGYFPCPRCHD